MKFENARLGLTLNFASAISVILTPCGAQASLTDGLVAHYGFTGNAVDSSGYGNDGTVYGAVLAQDRFGNPNSAYFFDGVDDFIQIPESTAFDSTAFSISLWFRAASFPVEAGMLISKGQNNFEIHTASEVTGPNGMKFLPRFVAHGVVMDWHTPDDTYAINQWTHVVGVYNPGTEIRFYVYGTEVPLIGPSVLHDASDNLLDARIGMRTDNTLAFHGEVDDVRIYNRVLTADEIRHLVQPRSIHLDFNAPTPGTLNDTNGLGTGFTTRLPGTGSALSANDPNMDLVSQPGYLSFTSQRSDIGQFNGFGRNLPALDAPGILLTDMVGKDFRVTAKFDNIQVPDLSDQLLLYVGTSADKVVRGGFHEFNSSNEGQYILAGNTGAGDFGFTSVVSGSGLFALGDDVRLRLSRLGGNWSLEWNNLSNPSASGSYSNVSIPWLDTENDLYVGLMHMDARNFTHQTAEIDYFCVEVIPEPTSMIILGGLISATLSFARYPKRARK